MHVKFGDYHVSDVQFVAAFDVDAKKVGRTSPRRSSPARTTRSRSATCRRPASPSSVARPSTVWAVLPRDGRRVRRASRSTSAAALPRGRVESWAPPTCRSDPSGADKFYAQAAIDAGCGFVNALPVFIGLDPRGRRKFTDAGLPIVGDDIKSQVGATIVHRALAPLVRGARVELLRTYSSTSADNMDFMNMLERTAWCRRRSRRPSR
jgi:myo-inositol-1-phosphate synthase